MCGDNIEQVAFGEDSYFEQIIQADENGLGYEKRRDTWKEGSDFPFVAELFAVHGGGGEENEEEEGGEKELGADDVIVMPDGELRKRTSADIVDVEVVAANDSVAK